MKQTDTKSVKTTAVTKSQPTPEEREASKASRKSIFDESFAPEQAERRKAWSRFDGKAN